MGNLLLCPASEFTGRVASEIGGLEMSAWVGSFAEKDLYREDLSSSWKVPFRGFFVFLQVLAGCLLILSFWLPYNIYSYVFGVGVGIAVVHAFLRPRASWNWQQFRPFLPWLVLYAFFWVSVLYSSDKVEAVNRCGRYLSLLLFPVVFIGMGPSFFTRKRVRLFALIFVVSCALEALCRTGVALHVFLTVPQLEHYRQAGFLAALNEFVGFQNIYITWSDVRPVMHTTFEALLLDMAFALTSIAWIGRDPLFERRGVRISAAFALFLFTLTLVSTNSKTGQILFLGTLVILGIHAWRNRRRRLVGIGLAVVLLSGVALFPFVGKGIFSRLTRSIEIVDLLMEKNLDHAVSDGSTLPRIHCWRLGWEMFKEHPLVGIGIGSHSDFTAAYQQRHGDLKVYAHPHNQFLFLLLSTGIIGLSVFLWFWCDVIGRVWRSRNSFWWIWLSGLFLVCMTDTLFNSLQGLFCFCAFYGLLCYGEKRNPDRIV